ncbi:MAG: PAS domain S-box protein [Ghiorsea sp.]|nr:PAS domain S-box protein [Ghiorsea sp.]
MNAVAVSQKGRWAYANPACLKLFGASSFEVLQGKPMMDSVHPDSWAIVKERTKQLKYHQATLSIIEEKFLRVDGSVFVAEVSASPIVFDGEASNLINIRDITELKRLEQEQKTMSSNWHKRSVLNHWVYWREVLLTTLITY